MTTKAAATPTAPFKSLDAGKGSQCGLWFGTGATAPATADDWKPLGYFRGFETSTSRDTIDITGSSSTGNIKESIDGFIEQTMSFDVVCRKESAQVTNQKTFYTAIQTDPTVWLCWSNPVLDLMFTQQVMVNSDSASHQYDDSLSLSFEATARGARTTADIA